MINLSINTNFGLFSNVLCGISALHYADDNNINLKINISNNRYTNNNENIWDLLFNQPKILNTNTEDIFFENWTPYGCTFCDFLNEDKVKSYFNLIKKYEILKNDDIEKCKNFFNGYDLKRTLGVHRRGTDHYMHGQILDINEYFSKIDKELETNNYDNIFLITDEVASLDAFLKKYGNKLIYTDSFKSMDNRPIHDYSYRNITNRVYEVYYDIIKLGMCEKMLITLSNVSSFATLINNNKFEYLDKHIVYT
jgi:hypothetical protein